jgi:hypothetical protein
MAPATAPTVPAATTLPASPPLERGGVGADSAGVGVGGACVAVPAETGNFFVGFGPLGAAPLGMGNTIGAGSAGEAGGRNDLLVAFLPAVPVAAGVLGNFEGMDRPCAGGSASHSPSSLSIFGSGLAP